MKKGELVTSLGELRTYPQGTYMWLTYNGKTKFGQFYWEVGGEITFYVYNQRGIRNFFLQKLKDSFLSIPATAFRSARIAEVNA